MNQIRLPILGDPESMPRPRVTVAWLSIGFRPFFVAAALHAAIFIPWWIVRLAGGGAPTAGAWLPIWWHAHEMLFGFTLAVIAGFLLTAVRNWTGRDTARGPALVGLLGLWLLGRVAMWMQTWLPEEWVAVAVMAFPVALIVAVGRPLLAARSRRNYGILVVLGLLALSCALMHLQAAAGDARALLRCVLVSVHLLVLLNVVIGGRVIPMFTWAATRGAPIHGWPLADLLAPVASFGLMLAVAMSASGAVFAGIAAVAGAINLLRMIPWCSRAALRVPLVLVLHVGYAWIGIGQLLLAASAAGLPLAESTALHALTIGVIGTMTLGMMVRVALGHSGRPVVASRLATLAIGLMFLAPLARLSALVLPARYWMLTVQTAGTLFALAFAAYLFGFARVLLLPRPDGHTD